MIARAAALCLAALLAASGATAQESMMSGHTGGECKSCHVSRNDQRFVIDPNRSSLQFSVDAYELAPVTGMFAGIRGGFLFDAVSLERSTVVATVPVDGLETGDALIDDLLRSERFLDAGAHPFIEFRSTGIEATGDHEGKLHGVLSIGGREQPLTLDAAFHHSNRHPLSGVETVAVTASGSVRRSEFGMTLGLPAIADDITVTIQAEGYRLQ